MMPIVVVMATTFKQATIHVAILHWIVWKLPSQVFKWNLSSLFFQFKVLTEGK